MKKALAIVLCLTMVLALAACGSSGSSASSGAPAEEKTYVIGISQLVPHVALDAATQGFKDAVDAALGDKVTYIEQNAAGDQPTCTTIANQLVAENVDLIMANATPALQAAASATTTIPVLGTSVTDYATALEIDDWTGVTGKNVSGTSDLAPLADQAAMFAELLPDARSIGLLYCSAEPNSIYQANVVDEILTGQGYSVKHYTFADTNEVANVTTSACANSDALYVPTDNTAATCTETINNVALPAGVPIIAGEEGIASGCGIAALTISYYDLGYATGEMAVDILVNGADISTMAVRFAPNVTKKYNPVNCEALGINIPAEYEAIAP